VALACSDYGDIMLMPTNKATTDPKAYASPFSKENEKADAVIIRKIRQW